MTSNPTNLKETVTSWLGGTPRTKHRFSRKVRKLIKSFSGQGDAQDGLAGRYPDFEPDVIEIISAVQPYTMTSPERIYTLVQSVKHVVSANVPGDFVECGVWKGGSMMAMALSLLSIQAAPRELRLFDTFEGMTAPADCDVDFRGIPAKALLEADTDRSTALMWAVAQLDEVRANMGRTNYPTSHIHYIQGKVESTLPAQAPERIALLRLDTDWYESTRHELEHLFPRLSPGGVLIIDDYGYFQGARKAVDEFIARHKVPLLLCRVDNSGRVAVKR